MTQQSTCGPSKFLVPSDFGLFRRRDQLGRSVGSRLDGLFPTLEASLANGPAMECLSAEIARPCPTVAARHLWSVVGAFVLAIHMLTQTANASDSAELMDRFEHFCIDDPLSLMVISGSAATGHLPFIDQTAMSKGGAGLRTTTWLIRKEPAAALIVVDKAGDGEVTMCGVSDHTTPLADMANELAFRIRTGQIKTRGMGVNDVPLEDDGGTVHIVSDPGGTSAAGFFLFRVGPRP